MEEENAEEKIRQAVLAIRKSRTNPAGRHWLDVAEGFLAQALALSSLHPEAREREEDGLACILAEPFGGWESLSVNELMARLRRAHAALPSHDARLATPKPEGPEVKQ